MSDFITAGAIREGRIALPADALDHATVARRLLAQAGRLPAGSVIALQASWGRGKTDVIARMAGRARQSDDWAWLWINPWQYGDANLLTPLVIELLTMIPKEKRWNVPALLKAARTVLTAGVSFGLKASGNALLAEAAKPAATVVGGLFDLAIADKPASAPDADPVARMSVRFDELVGAVLEATGAKQLVVCVDDLDRCLPDRQVALLQALRFLLDSTAEVRFVLAIDPTLAKQALKVHYNAEYFDPDLYLDKMFDLRVNLPAVGDADVGELLRSHFDRTVAEGRLGDVLGAGLGTQWVEALAEQGTRALCTPDLRNPRLVRRIVDRMYLLVTTEGVTPPRLGASVDARWLLIWLAIAERWPAVRTALQSDRAAFQKNLAQLHQHMLGRPVKFETPALALLKDPTDAQRQIFAALGRDRLDSSVPALLFRVDTALVKAGL